MSDIKNEIYQKERKGQVVQDSFLQNTDNNINQQQSSLETVQLVKQRNFKKNKNNSFIQNNRPFFSIVIPCYNSTKDLGNLLQSIVQQELTKNELEVIIADDCSTKIYSDIVTPYQTKLNIKYCQTDYNYCPGNTRQRGVDNASGEWVIFADHDDLFEPNVFKTIKEIVEQNSEIVLCVTAFRHVSEQDLNEVLEQYVPSEGYGWTHGKFFNLDNFWKKYNFHYPKDLESHEDIAITSQCICILEEHPELKAVYMDGFNTYKWIAHKKSTSNKIYSYKDDPTPRPFIDVFLGDYLKSTLSIYLEAFKNNQISGQTAKSLILSGFLFGYFYQEGNVFKNFNYIEDNYKILSNYLREIRACLGMGVIDIYNYYKNNLSIYYKVEKESFNAVGVTIYEHTLKEWLEMLVSKNYY